MDIKSNNAVYEIKTAQDFKSTIENKSLGFVGFEHAKLQDKDNNKEPSSLAVAAQIGGSGIQIGITGLKANNEVSIFELPKFKKANGETTIQQQIQDAKDNYGNFRTLAQIIEFVGDYADGFNQENFDVDIGVAGFDAHNPPANMGDNTKAKAREGKDGEYYMANVPFDSGDGRGAVNFFNPSMLFTKKLRNRTTGFSFRSERGTIASPFKVNGSILNDTVTLACSHTEGLKIGDSSVGVVCGTGFNMGIAKGFNGVGFDDLKDANLELGHWEVSPDAKYLSPFDIPFVQDGKLLDSKEREELVKTKSPETLFSGSSAEARSIKNILINIRDLVNFYNKPADKTTLKALNTGIDLEEAEIAITQLESQKPLEQFSDIEIGEALKPSTTTTANNFFKNLYLDYFKRLGILIGETLKGQGVDNPKAINFTGSYFVEPMKTLEKADQLFRVGLQSSLDLDLKSAEGIKINLTSREEMDGMVTMIKTKANAESKRRIETLAAMNRAGAVGA